MSGSLFCFGYGYTCDHLGQELTARGGWSVAGTTRDRDRRNSLRAHGIKAYLFDPQTPLGDPTFFLQDVTHLLISVPPDDSGDPALSVHGLDIAYMPNLKWLGYLSSTSVYGNRYGGWVNETSAEHPDSKRGSRRLKAERQWQELAAEYNLPLHIFRLAGIYGPGRSALDSVRAGTARRIDKPGHAFNRVHIHDIIQVLIASMCNPAPGNIYNICDDEAAPSHEMISFACRLLHIPPPPMIPYEEADLAPITRSFYEDNKRIENSKIKEQLGIKLKYPNHRLGLQACLEDEIADLQQTQLG
ncbi:MAG: SDR family oxidoreductase [Rhodospirillales bacterium]|nr:SDR family oxidoreductase [Rhodospirillales bacterium]MCB9965588.1 SDR family oxidoreductase [Rhodospirillales bacterium]MCB9979829.1 SDR family oxidoreductase [Rhodospirillales bacterium]